MTVERIGPLDPASNVNKTEKPAKLKAKSDVDSINVSEEARSKAEVFKALEAAKAAPDVRMDRVEEVRRKLQDPSYPSGSHRESGRRNTQVLRHIDLRLAVASGDISFWGQAEVSFGILRFFLQPHGGE